mgnify:CR=1 FL=1
MHTHCTTGLGPLTLQKAVEAGADVIDTAISCFSGGTAQPATETLAYALRQEGYEVSLDDKKLKEINDFFKPIRAQALESGLLNPVVLSTETDALVYQVPGGMLSNLVAQLTAQKSLDKLDEVLAEVPRVRKDLGYPPLVTPMSQMVGVQATANVLAGERYKNVSKEIKPICTVSTAALQAKSTGKSKKKFSAMKSQLPCAMPTCWSPVLKRRRLSSASVPNPMRMFFPISHSPRRRKSSLTIAKYAKRTPSPIPSSKLTDKEANALCWQIRPLQLGIPS